MAGVNLEAVEQNHCETDNILRSLNIMGSDSYAFIVILVDERENQAIDRRTVDRRVDSEAGHPKNNLVRCKIGVWDRGRCFCRATLMRYFDRFGRIAVTFSSEDLMS